MNDLEKKFRYLNIQQKKAVKWIKGPILVIAGAGTGKTRVLVNRVAYLVKKGIDPSSILLLTFTRRAAKEMLDRASIILQDEKSINRVAGGTFHSFANKILRKHYKKIGLSNNYTILDKTDSSDVIDMMREKIGISRKEKRFPFKKTLEKIINLSINKELDIEKIIEEDYPQFISETEDIKKISDKYTKYKLKNNLLDYNDLLIHLKTLLEKNSEVINNFKYIMIDEFQDTNKIQGYLGYLLAKDHKNIMVVGDDTQSIYSFRGAYFKNMFDFIKKYFPESHIIKLEENYRSTQPILNLANVIIDNAVEKYTKALFTKRKKGIIPTLIPASNEENQAQIISEKILYLHNLEKIPLDQIAVLFRASYQAIPLEIQLNKKNIPYVKHGGFKFFETAHIKDIVAYLKVLQNPKDEISWNRILLLLEGIGKVTSNKIRTNITNSYKPYTELLNQLKKQKHNSKLQKLGNLFEELTKKQNSPFGKLEKIIKYYLPILKNKFDDFPKRKEDLMQLKYMSKNYISLEKFLTDMSLEPPTKSVSDVLHIKKEDEGYLCLSTIHSAKGLEWETVFIIDLLEGRFPLSHYTISLESIEEERRLFYVACTRAKNNLFLSYPIITRNYFSQKSEFLEEIEHLTEKIDVNNYAL